MRFIRVIPTAALILLFGTLVPVYAQHEQQGERQGKPEKQQGKREQGAPPQAQQQRPQQQQGTRTGQRQNQPQERHPQPPAQQQQQQRAEHPQQQQQQRQGQDYQQARQQQQPQQRTRQQAMAWQQQRGWLQQGDGWQGHNTWQQGRTQQWDRDHRTWAQRGGYGGYFIPHDRFSRSFGSQHWFRMQNRPTMYMGYPRFEYGGYYFLLVDPWPESWAENWYSSDDVYIDYSDGYYLYDPRYPYVRLAISVVL